MKKKILIFILLTLIIFSFVPVSMAKLKDWNVFETDNFLIFYPDGYQWQADELAYYLEKYLPGVKKLSGNHREFKTRIIIQDTGLNSNAYAFPGNYKISIFTTNPASTTNLDAYQNWYRKLTVHELTHIYQINNFSGLAESLSNIFTTYLSPNFHSPMWILEGITVYNESSLSDYSGRLNHGYHHAVLADKVINDNFPSINETNYVHNHFPLSQHYIYGSLFFQYLAREYGEDKLAEYFTTYGSYYWTPFIADLFPEIGIDKAAKKVFGKTFPELYQNWQKSAEKEYASFNLNSNIIADTHYGYISGLTASNNKLYYFKTDRYSYQPYKNSFVSTLTEYNPISKKKKSLLKINPVLNSKIKIKDNLLYFSARENKNGYANIELSGQGFTSILYEYNLNTGKKTEIFSADFRDFVIEDGRIVYVIDNKDKFGSCIWQFKDGKKEKLGEIDELITEIIKYHDKYLLVSKKDFSSWNINLLSLKNLSLIKVIHTPEHERGLSIVGENIYFKAGYNGQQAIYKYNMKEKTLKKIEGYYYAESGVALNNSLYYTGISSKGEKIYSVSLDNSKITTMPEAEIIKSIDYSSINNFKVKRSIWKSNYHFFFKPYIKFLPHLLMAEDALGLNDYTISYSPYGGLNFFFNSRLLTALEINFANYDNKDDRISKLKLTYPLYSSLRKGLSSAKISLETNFTENLLGFDAQFSYLTHRAYTKIEKEIADESLYAALKYNYLLPEGSLNLEGSYQKNFDYSRYNPFYADDEKINERLKLKASFIHRIKQVRKGIWNPNLFLADIYAGPFIEYRDNDGEKSNSYGLSLAFETGFASYIHLVPKLEFSITDNGEQDFNYQLRLDF